MTKHPPLRHSRGHGVEGRARARASGGAHRRNVRMQLAKSARRLQSPPEAGVPRFEGHLRCRTARLSRTRRCAWTDGVCRRGSDGQTRWYWTGTSGNRGRLRREPPSWCCSHFVARAILPTKCGQMGCLSGECRIDATTWGMLLLREHGSLAHLSGKCRLITGQSARRSRSGIFIDEYRT